eukprot:gb/GECG01015592.1/.p1 GENE.gb/GECG01015592.1/~~gb/GECG01015592.1/.p1  ORF type:complete len:621 (+),score=69.37 gb/GECG01015592.1/:1-1863(+)
MASGTASASAPTQQYVTDIHAIQGADSSTKHLKYDSKSVYLGGVNIPEGAPEIAKESEEKREDTQWWWEQKRKLSQNRWEEDWTAAQENLKHNKYLFTNESVLLSSDVAAAIFSYIAQWDEEHQSVNKCGLQVEAERYKGCLILKYILRSGAGGCRAEEDSENALLAENDHSLGIYKKTLGHHRFLILQRRVHMGSSSSATGNLSIHPWSESTNSRTAVLDSLLTFELSKLPEHSGGLQYDGLLRRFDMLLHLVRKQTSSKDTAAFILDLQNNGTISIVDGGGKIGSPIRDSLLPLFVDRTPAPKRNTSDTPAPGTLKRGKDVLSRPTRWQDDAGNKVNLAIIVPYRNQQEQNRADQLDKFAKEMPYYIRTYCDSSRVPSFHIFVIEQSDDGYKFNRGKLLNIGYAIAFESGKDGDNGFNAFCLHDVDLLPGPELADFYSMRPERPIHIAAAWDRYKSLRNYIGGILTLSDDIFRKTNGLPNNYWGWGGEDDELWDRLVETGHRQVVRPNPEKYKNSITDLEDKFIHTKGGIRAGQTLKKGGKSEFRNMRKHELREQHETTWRKNGIKDLVYRILDQRSMNMDVTVYTVDLMGDRDPEAAKLSEEVKEYGQNFKKTRRMD